MKEFKEFGRILEQLPENGLAPIQHILQSDWEAIGAKTTPHCLNSELRKIYGSEEIRG